MSIGQKEPIKRYSLFVLAVIMLIAAGVLLAIGFNNFMYRSLGLVMCIVSVYLVKASNVSGLIGFFSKNDQNVDTGVSERPGFLVWGFAAASAMAFGLSFVFLYRDAVNGYHEFWPLYMFAGSSVIFTVVWSYLFTKLMQMKKKR